MVTFRESDHSYWNADGVRYESVTTFISRAFGGFNRQEAIQRAQTSLASRYCGWSAEDICKEWDRIRDDGTELHKSVERAVRTSRPPEGKYNEAAGKFIGARWRGTLRVEVVLWNHELQLAGTADALEMTRQGWWLWDIKTSAKLQEQKELKYQLQLAFYRMMAEEIFRVPVITGGIVWFPDLANNPRVNPQRVPPRDVSLPLMELIDKRRKELTDGSYQQQGLTFFEQPLSFVA